MGFPCCAASSLDHDPAGARRPRPGVATPVTEPLSVRLDRPAMTLIGVGATALVPRFIASASARSARGILLTFRLQCPHSFARHAFCTRYVVLRCRPRQARFVRDAVPDPR